MRWVQLALLAVLACGPGMGRARGPYTPEVVQAEEIDGARAPTALDALIRLRPHWFSGDRRVVNVIQNGQRIGGPEMLRSFNPAELRSARRIGDMETHSRYGRYRGASIIIEVRYPK